jgi:hypothetical protein
MQSFHRAIAAGFLLALFASPVVAGWSAESIAVGIDAAQLTNAQGREDDAITAPVSFSLANGRWQAGLRGGAIRYRNGGAVGAAGRSTTGFADTTLTFGYDVLPARLGRVSLTASLFAKLPTAPKRIGTGKPDGGVQIDLVVYAGRIIPFGSLSYRVNGRVAGQAMRNSLHAHLGAQTMLNPRLAVGAYGLFRQSAFKTVSDYRDIVAYGSFAVGERWTLLGYGTASVGPRAGDFGGGLQLRYRFSDR